MKRISLPRLGYPHGYGVPAVGFHDSAVVKGNWMISFAELPLFPCSHTHELFACFQQIILYCYLGERRKTK